jgi:hypothetical protein
MAGPRKPRETGKSRESAALTQSMPPGDFLSADFASDCARFLAEAKERARRRAEAGRREHGPPRPPSY